MSHPNETLSVGEFHRSMQRIEDRFDTLDMNVTRAFLSHAERIAVLEAAKKQERKKQMSLAGVITVIAVAAGEFFRRFLGL